MRKLSLLITALPLFIFSCTSADVEPEVSFVGKWQVKSIALEYKEVGEELESESEDVFSENLVIELKADGSFATNYSSNDDEDFSLFPETVATYSVVDNTYLLVKSNDPNTDVPEVKYKFQFDNDILTLSLDKDLTRNLFQKGLELNSEALAFFGYTVEEFLNEFFADVEVYNTILVLQKIE